jgi:hypothetical protein
MQSSASYGFRASPGEVRALRHAYDWALGTAVNTSTTRISGEQGSTSFKFTRDVRTAQISN